MKIIFILGTKAQFIKTIPMINYAIEKKLEVTLFDLKQHPEKSTKLINKINGKYSYINYVNNSKDLGTYFQLLRWSCLLLIKVLFRAEKEIRDNLCIVHGDTLSTLLGALLIKRNRGRLVLLEAGLGFPGMFKHFPESFVRYYVAKMSDFLIANGNEQINQLKEWNVKGKILEISRNTIYDSLGLVNLKKNSNKNKVIVSIHRTENINNKENMKLLVKNLIKISNKKNLIWYLHIPTKNKLIQYNLIEDLLNNNIIFDDLIPYEEFLNEIYNSEFVITDGDGVVEECYILGIPTLVWRYEHLDSNHLFEGKSSLYLSEFDEEKCNYFFENYANFKCFEDVKSDSPSVEALNKLIS